MSSLSLTNLLHSLILEYGLRKDGTYYINANDLSYGDKRLILSHITSSEEYEYLCSNDCKTQAFYLENEKYIQALLDSECDQVYRAEMEDRKNFK